MMIKRSVNQSSVYKLFTCFRLFVSQEWSDPGKYALIGAAAVLGLIYMKKRVCLSSDFILLFVSWCATNDYLTDCYYD